MKTLKNLLFIIGFTGIMFSCSKVEQPGFDVLDLSGRNFKSHLIVNPGVFIVEPTGGDDTPAIKQAFIDATAFGPGSVVQLCEGEYHLGYLEVYDFYGSLRGAGKGKTVITAIGGIDIDALWAQHLMVCLIKFVGGDMNLSHFTIQTPPGKLSVGGPGMGHIYSLLNFSAFNAVYELGNENRSINVVIDNVHFKGQLLEGGPGYVQGYNCLIPVRAGFDCFNPYAWSAPPVPREKIDIKITSSEFDTFCYGLGFEGMKNSNVIIGEKNKGNIFSNFDCPGGVWESRDSKILIEGNTFNSKALCYGLQLDDYAYYPRLLKNEIPTKATLFNIQNNVFNLAHAYSALYLRNLRRNQYPGDIPVAFQVRNNEFNMTDGYKAIEGYRTQGMVIRNNKFSGNGDIAVYLGYNSIDGLVLGNNFSTTDLLTGAIYLVASTRNWTIVGGNIKDRVIDLGTDNIITGVNVSTSDIPLGQRISDNLPPMNRLMHW